MAIQISEKFLSPEAKSVLDNAKNKSQLLRDALEFYVKYMKGQVNSSVEPGLNKELENDVKDIKKMLLELCEGNKLVPIKQQNTTDISKSEESLYKSIINKDKEPNEEFNIRHNDVMITENKSSQITEKRINKEDNINKGSVKERNNNMISEAEKEEIEKMLDASLNNFNL